jgi:cytochrome c oxidase cbb3-type subunit III
VRTLTRVLALAAVAGCGKGKPVAAVPDSTAARPDSAVPLAVRYDQHLFAGGNPPLGATPTNPYAGQTQSAAEGEKLFASMNCDGCHGYGATGWVGPSLSDGRWIYGGSDAAVFQSIYYGRPHGMPAFGGMLQPPIIWKLVTYIRSLPVPKSVPTQSW